MINLLGLVVHGLHFSGDNVSFNQMYMDIVQDFWNHYTPLGNCPPTPPLGQHFALSENKRTENAC